MILYFPYYFSSLLLRPVLSLVVRLFSQLPIFSSSPPLSHVRSLQCLSYGQSSEIDLLCGRLCPARRGRISLQVAFHFTFMTPSTCSRATTPIRLIFRTQLLETSYTQQ
ncbi:hypothetical protein F5884DRAFT_425154 [Xylogone sp. PMI_703]|nr:hypothetical protein F5884DRAFT_425154 [Xylogone sp. PMI_703]